MKTVLFLPFLQISSGHHQVADALADLIENSYGEVNCKKVDILSYGFGAGEKLVSTTYLKWIHYCPSLYNWIYQKASMKKTDLKKRFYLYEWLFEDKMRKLLKEIKPHIIVCTHALPSYLLSRLKATGEISTPVINAYTDFFANNLWGRENVDYHFVADHLFKEKLLEKGIHDSRILITGIPIHRKIDMRRRDGFNGEFYQILITGGSLGVGKVDKFISSLQPNKKLRYVVLCGKNKRLYNFVKSLNHPYLTALQYIESREEMSKVYDQADAIITKPGGVTISECLHKNIPIFIYDHLPGQEEINLNHLKKAGVVLHLCDLNGETIEEQIENVLGSKQSNKRYQETLNYYHTFIKREKLGERMYEIMSGLS